MQKGEEIQAVPSHFVSVYYYSVIKEMWLCFSFEKAKIIENNTLMKKRFKLLVFMFIFDSLHDGLFEVDIHQVVHNFALFLHLELRRGEGSKLELGGGRGGTT